MEFLNFSVPTGSTQNIKYPKICSCVTSINYPQENEYIYCFSSFSSSLSVTG